MTDGLVGYWNTKQGITGNTWNNIALDTEGLYNATITGATLQSDGVLFSGANDLVRISVPTELRTVGNPYTIEVLITQHSNASSRQLFGTGTYTSLDQWGAWYQHYEGNTWDTEIGHSVDYNSVNNQPLSIVATFNPSTKQLVYYFNGVHIQTFTITNNVKWAYGNNVDIGYDQYGDPTFQGLVHLLRIYNRALTSQEIQQNYAVGKEVGMIEPDPIPIIKPPKEPIYWQLQGIVPTDRPEPIYDIDGFDNPKSTFDTLKAKGKYMIAYFSAGTWENWRSDASRFPTSVRGNNVDGWEGERWLDIRQLDILRPIMEARADIALAKGAQAIEWDNIDGYANGAGFSLTKAHQVAYNTMLAEICHDRGLAAIYKNADLAIQLEPLFDALLIEEAYQWGDTNVFTPFINAGKPIWAIEYEGVLNCVDAGSKGIYLARYHIDLDRPPIEICGVVPQEGTILARVTQDGKLLLVGEFIEGNTIISLDTYGDLKVDEIIEGQPFSFKDNKLYVNEVIEGVDLDGTT